MKLANNFMGMLVFALTLIFVIAKILGYVDWSWGIVFAPLIIYVCLVILIYILMLIIIGVMCLIL